MSSVTYVAMKATSFLAFLLGPFVTSSLLSKRGDVLTCSPTSSCATYPATSIWYGEMSAGTCPALTPPIAADMTSAMQADHPESCYYPESINHCQSGQYTNLMVPMSIIATAIYNEQSPGAVVCGRTKTANLPTFVARTLGLRARFELQHNLLTQD